MNRWTGKIAVVTGASAGIGLATVQLLLREGLIVVGLARRKNRMEEQTKDIQSPGKFYARECDITKQEDVESAFDWIKDTFGKIHILINNAGVLREGSIADTPIEDLQFVINVNLMGAVYCAKRAVKLMKEHAEEAHIVNINSIAGNVTPRIPGKHYNVYAATKFALRSLSEALRHELIDTRIRVCNLSPGVVKTEIFEKGDIDLAHFDTLPMLTSKDIANAIIHVIGSPEHVEITQLTIQPKGEIL